MKERFSGIKEKFNNFMDKAMEHAFNNTMEFYEMKPGEDDPQELLKRLELDEAKKRESGVRP